VLFVLRAGDEDYNTAAIRRCKLYAEFMRGNIIVGAREHYASMDLRGVEVIHQLGAYDTKIRMQLEGRANRRCALVGLPLPWVVMVFAYFYADDLGAPQYSCDTNSERIYSAAFRLQREVERIIATQSMDRLAHDDEDADEVHATRLRRGLEESDAARRWAELRARRNRRLAQKVTGGRADGAGNTLNESSQKESQLQALAYTFPAAGPVTSAVVNAH
jgi:hypothetical protein